MNKLAVFFFLLSLLTLGACNPDEGVQLASVAGKDQVISSGDMPFVQASDAGSQEQPEYQRRLQAFVATSNVNEAVGRKKAAGEVGGTVGHSRLRGKEVTEIEIRIRRSAAEAKTAKELAEQAAAEAQKAMEAAKIAAEAAHQAEAEAAAKRAAAAAAAKRANEEEMAKRAAAEKAAAEEAARMAAAEEAARMADLEAARRAADMAAKEAAAAEARRVAAEAAAQEAMDREAQRQLQAERKAGLAKEQAEKQAAEAREAAIKASRVDILFYINGKDRTKKLPYCLRDLGESIEGANFLKYLDKTLNWQISFAAFSDNPKLYPLERNGYRLRLNGETQYLLRKGMFSGQKKGLFRSSSEEQMDQVFRDSLVNDGPQYNSRGDQVHVSYDAPQVWGSYSIGDPIGGLLKLLKDGSSFRENAKKYIVVVDQGHLSFYSQDEWSAFFAESGDARFILMSPRRSTVSAFPVNGSFKWIPFCGHPNAVKNLAEHIVESYAQQSLHTE